MSRSSPGDEIRTFLGVCDTASFANAAERLALSPSAVAKAVARLETRLGVRLFNRTTRSVALTQEGMAYRDVCRVSLAEIDRVEAVLSDVATAPAGRVRVSLPPLFGADIVAPALYRLCDTWPRLSFAIEAGTEMTDLLRGEVDLAIRIGELPELTGVASRRLGTQRVTLCASSAYLEGRAPPRSIDDLASHALIGNARHGRLLPWRLRQADGRVLNWSPPARLHLDGSLLALAAIRADRGIGMVPRWLVAADIAAGRLQPLLEDQVEGHLPIHAVWPETPIMLPRMRVTLAAVAEAVVLS